MKTVDFSDTIAASEPESWEDILLNYEDKLVLKVKIIS